MTMNVNVSGIFKEIIRAFVNVSGVDKEIIEGFENVSGVWKRFYFALRASAAPDFVSGSSGVPGTITTNSTTCTAQPDGGTFSWEFVSGDPSIIPTASALATTAFEANVQDNGTIQATFRCRYTFQGEEVVTNNVTAELTLF